jgi:hypothetical protein
LPYIITDFVFNTTILAILCILIVGVRGGWQRVILQINDAYSNGRIDSELKLN